MVLSKGRKPRPHGWSRRGKGWGREGWREDWREERGEPCRDFLGHRGFKLLNQFIAVFEWEEVLFEFGLQEGTSGFFFTIIRGFGGSGVIILSHLTGPLNDQSDWVFLFGLGAIARRLEVWYTPQYIYICIYIHICKPLADESMTGNPFLNSSWWTPGSNQNWVTGYFHSHVV